MLHDSCKRYVRYALSRYLSCELDDGCLTKIRLLLFQNRLSLNIHNHKQELIIIILTKSHIFRYVRYIVGSPLQLVLLTLIIFEQFSKKN